jgi:hypothetical protein
MDKHPIRTGIITGIIGSIIATLILDWLGYLPSFISSLFRRIFNLCIRAWTYSVSSTPVYRWLLWLLILISAIALFRILKPLFTRHSDEPKLKTYRQDFFENVIWRWDYNLLKEPTNIRAYCPQCDTLLVHSQPSFWTPVKMTILYCEKCKQPRAEIEGGSVQYVIAMIKRLIDSKIRSGEWKR